jgi:hypothetical protein
MMPKKSENDSNLPIETQSEPNKGNTIQEEEVSNTVPFPTVSELENEANTEAEQSQSYGPGRHVQPKPRGSTQR